MRSMDTQRTTIMSDLSGRTTVVIGASLGLGRGIRAEVADAADASVMRPFQYQTEETFSVNSHRGTRGELCCSSELGMRR